MKNNHSGFAFEKDVKRSGDFYGIYLRKIPTPMYTTGLYDFLGLWKGIYVAIECKASSEICPIQFSRVTEWQVKELLDVDKNGGFSYILWNFRVRRSQELYAIPIKRFLSIKDDYEREGKKSLSIVNFNILPKINRDYKNSVWDIRALFQKEFYRRGGVNYPTL